MPEKSSKKRLANRANRANTAERDFAKLAHANPLSLFARWFADAQNAGIAQPEAMTLATATANNQPRARTVLLKDFSADGFVFFTNLGSRKADALQQNRRAALLFYWPQLDRQILVQGIVRAVSRQRTAAYFLSRPRQSQLNAWASAQSQPIESPTHMRRIADLTKARFANEKLSLPSHWGGFILSPRRIEFWQADDFRLHQRIEFTRRNAKASWQHQFLQP